MRLFGPPDIEKLSARGDVAGLAKALRHKQPELRKQAAKALGKLGGPSAVDHLIAALRDPHMGVREETVDALAGLKDPAVVDALVAALGDPVDRVRRRAVWGLWAIKDGRAVEPLGRVLEDPSEQARDANAEVLGYFRDPRSVGPLAAALRTTWRAKESLLTLARLSPGPVVDAMLTALEDGDHRVCEAAAEILGAAGDWLVCTRPEGAIRDVTGRLISNL